MKDLIATIKVEGKIKITWGLIEQIKKAKLIIHLHIF